MEIERLSTIRWECKAWWKPINQPSDSKHQSCDWFHDLAIFADMENKLDRLYTDKEVLSAYHMDLFILLTHVWIDNWHINLILAMHSYSLSVKSDQSCFPYMQNGQIRVINQDLMFTCLSADMGLHQALPFSSDSSTKPFNSFFNIFRIAP